MNKDITHWKASKKTAAAILEIDRKADEFLKPYRAFARKVGMSTTVITGLNIMGDESVVGFQTKRGADDPDTKLWKKHKQTFKGRDVWVPKAVKAMEWWRQHQYDSFFTPSYIEDALDIKVNPPGGLGYAMPGVIHKDGIAYLQMQAWQGKPKGCRRISDITYQKAKAAK